MVYLWLQPYRQSSLKQKGAEKLKPRFYGPYRVIRRIGHVAYELELPQGSKIHNVFHVSCLKKALGQQVTVTDELPTTDDEGHLVLQRLLLIPRRGSYGAGRSENSWWGGRIYGMRMPLGRVRKFCSIHHFSCLRTSNILPRETIIFLISHG